MNTRHFSALGFVFLATATALVAAQAAGVQTATPAGGEDGGTALLEPPTSGLESALATIDAEEIRSDLMFLASDEMAGRDSPSEEQRIAARFIRSRLQRLGFQAGAKDGFFQEYPLDYKALDLPNTWLSVKTSGGQTQRLQFGTDYYAWVQLGLDLDVSGTAVWVGEESADTFGGEGLKGKWLVSLMDAEKPASSRKVTRWAKKAGAIGLLRVSAPGVDSGFEKQFGRAISRYVKGSVRYPSKEDEERRRTREVGLPVDHIEPEVFERILEVEGGLSALVPGMELFELTEQRRKAGEGNQVTLENVCGFWPGSDPVLSKEVILLSAHYDHVGVSDGEIYNGADDNGSGTSTLLAVAEALNVNGPMRRSVMLIWVSAEEKGLLGSKAWTLNPWLPEGCRPLCNLNIDMVGRNAGDYLLITPSPDHDAYSGLTRLAEAAGREEGFPKLGSADDYWERSDQVNFSKNLGIPVAFLFSDVHEDYHQPTDDPEKIDYDKVRRVARLVVRMIGGLQADELDL